MLKVQLKPMKLIFNLFTSLCLVICSVQISFSQRYLTDYDSTLFMKDTVRPFLRRMENLHFSGYIQPQFQVTQSKGASSFEGGNFSEFSNNRFMLRRARIKLDYQLPSSKEKTFPNALFSFQIDATERGVNVRDMYVRLYEPKSQNFSLTMGLFARPFGYEVNLSSAYRETPERGRMSQILMPTERDLGAMIGYDKINGKKKSFFRWEIGAFNGQGLAPGGTTDFDSYKDIISRIMIKPIHLSKQFLLSGGLSLLHGGWRQATKYKYEMGMENGINLFKVDSSVSNIGDEAPRHYYGSDAQLIYNHQWGKTELRGEYWFGTQPGTATSTVNPGTLPLTPTYIRKFNGAFFYFLQNIIDDRNELMVKYDWYDPNVKVSSGELGKPATNLTAADIKFSTLGFGFARYIKSSLKLLAYYDFVRNEKTNLTEFTQNIKDNVFTLRIQMRF
jgi:hypothetical protein